MPGLTTDQIEQLQRDGYLLVEGARDPELDLAPVEREFEGILEDVANELKAAGSIRDTYAGLPFAERLIAVAGEAPEPIVPRFEIALAMTSVDPHARIVCGQATSASRSAPRPRS